MLDLSDIQKTQYEHKRERNKKMSQMRGTLAHWNKKELQAYVYNNNKKFPSCDAGTAVILERFIYRNEFKIGSMSEELKMGFDIVLSISRNKKIYFQTTDLIFEFITYYKEVINSYDRQSAQTYYHKLIIAYEKSVIMVKRKLEIEQELRMKY